MKGSSPLSAVARILALMAFSLVAVPTQAAVVALFADTNYVDYIPSDPDAEASNLEASLTAQGHTVNTFTGVTAADWSTALSGVDVLAVPEQENDAIYPALEAGAVTAVEDFVNNGGTLLITQDYEGFLNGMFGWALTQTGNDPYDLVAANAAGTSFAGGPATLPYNNDTSSYSNLPAGSTCMYENTTGDCTVFTVAIGSGAVISLGWDWYNAAPTGTGDDGWLDVLSRSMAYQVAAPTAHSIPTLGWPALFLLSLTLLGFGARLRGGSIRS